MGKFANPVEGGEAKRECIKLPWNGESGFNAMGHEVPSFRKSAAERHMKEMGLNNWEDAESRFTVVSQMSACIERDNTHEALELAMRAGWDATACYRLLSVLLTEPQPVTDNQEEE